MPGITLADVAESVGLARNTPNVDVVERNEFHLVVGQQSEPHYVGCIPGDFGRLLPDANLMVAQFYWEAGQGAGGDELHGVLHYQANLPAHVRYTITDQAQRGNTEAVVCRRGDRTRRNIGGRIVDTQDYFGERQGFFTIGQFPAQVGGTYDVRVAASADGVTFTEYDVLPAAHQLPLDKATRQLAAAWQAEEDWIAARYDIPGAVPAGVREASLVGCENVLQRSENGGKHAQRRTRRSAATEYGVRYDIASTLQAGAAGMSPLEPTSVRRRAFPCAHVGGNPSGSPNVRWAANWGAL